MLIRDFGAPRWQEAEDAVKRAAALAEGMNKEQLKRIEAAKHSSRTAICVKQFVLPELYVKVDDTTTNDAEQWWNSTLNKNLDKDSVLWTPRMDGEVPEDIAGLVEAYGGKSVLLGYRGFSDDFPKDTEKKSYDEMMSDFREHERLQKGRTTQCKGTPSARPSQTEDPMGSMKWLNKITAVPQGLVKPSAADKIRALKTLSDMSEELTVSEAAEMVELGAVGPLVDLVNEAEDEHLDKGLHQYLHGTKEGSKEEQDAYVWQVHSQCARSLRNLLCILSSDFSLQSKAGSGKIGAIKYEWLPADQATFVDVIVTMPGMFEMMFRLLVHESPVTQEHSTFALLHMV